MSFYKQLILVIVGMIAGYNSRSQVALSGWVTTNNQIALTKSLIYQLEASGRTEPQRQHLQTFLLRTGAFVQLNNQWSVGAGYCLTEGRRTINGTSSFAAEHQALEQVWFTHNVYLGSAKNKHTTLLRHRLRLENRFLPKLIWENNAIKRTGSAFANRLRYQIRQQIPLVRVTSSFDKGMFLILQNEVFFNVSGQQHVNGQILDQNRSLLATGYRFSRKFDLELSYMLRVVKEPSKRWSRESIIQVTAFSRI
ncbi:DUF2490 domain-containing protein [Longitalea arenae]|uniref:DUF2490 domain-containing protein n=1 Tax=Longitalea arenae TaxID=2812558 RepID=UPI001967701D|nr:DUF2490 domain-containing protein [Longitalea arenae]